MALAAGVGAGAAHAAEYGTGPWVKGYTDIFGGIFPPVPGFYVRNDAYHYEGDAERTYSTGLLSSAWKMIHRRPSALTM